MLHPPSFVPLKESDRPAVVAWVSTQSWPFHSRPHTSPEAVAKAWDEGAYFGPEVAGFWVELAGERVGLLRVQDLNDEGGNPCLDLRLRAEHRGQGLGTASLRFLTDWLFTHHPEEMRLEGQTRVDNLAMRKAFRRCGYVKEAHYRQAWPSGLADGLLLDSIGYAILRADWVDGACTPVPWDDEPA